MRILVCGGRTFHNFQLLTIALNDIAIEFDCKTDGEEGDWLPTFHIISGGAKGADSLAEDYATINGCAFTEYPADWNKHGKAAGPIRNQQMLDEGKPDLVVAFPGGNGTADMVSRAKKAGVEVRQVTDWLNYD